MEEPKSLDSLFKEKIFRIPDYQRGYAWRKEQLKDFWEDLVNLADGRKHYTGVLTLKELPEKLLGETHNEYWLVEDHSYKVYHIVDGQQRLTTFIIFLQSFMELIRALSENKGKPDNEIYLTESLSIAEVVGKYLFKTKPTGDQFRTYKFGYTVDNPSYKYLRHKIFEELGGGSCTETFYTLNLNIAKLYFHGQLEGLYKEEGLDGLRDVYKKLTRRFLFNEYIIKDEFDVFVAFETMNNRGKKLSDLELLKNRLIYLTTLYNVQELDASEHCSLRESINNAWKEVYHQLGRNHACPLNDDDFLRAHWIMYFKYSRKTGRDYIHFLLDEQFTPQKIHKKIEREVLLELPEEQFSDMELNESEIESENGEEFIETAIALSAQLQPIEIKTFVVSLKESAVHWFSTFYPNMVSGMDPAECEILQKLNRLGFVYFRPLVMAVLKNEKDVKKRIELFYQIERFIFLVFRMTNTRANYRSSEFYNVAREFDRGKITIEEIIKRLDARLKFTFNDDGTYRINEFFNLLHKKFESGKGYYGWSGLRYFLYEYELGLLSKSRQRKVCWEDLLKAPGDKVSIEHIYPQSGSKGWKNTFASFDDELRRNYKGSLGNLLLLSMSINSSLQDDDFEDKKTPKFNASGDKIRNGYADGSHSEIEVAQYDEWGPEEILERGLKLLDFMSKRWGVKFKDNAEKTELLFIETTESD